MPSPPTNSLLNLLNPYASITASQAAGDGDGERDGDHDTRDGDNDNDRDGDSEGYGAFVPESPSAVLLRELQYESGSNPNAIANARRGSTGTGAGAASGAAGMPGSRGMAAAMARGRSLGAGSGSVTSTPVPRGSPPMSPTPTPGNPRPSAAGKGKSKPPPPNPAPASASASASSASSHVAPVRPSHIIADSSDDDGPPQSLMFDGARDGGDGGSTPTSRSLASSGVGPGGLGGLAAPAPRWKTKDASRSPGPFRRRPSSTSSSTQSPTSPRPRVLDPEPRRRTPPLHALANAPPPDPSTESESGHSPRSTSTESELPTARPWPEVRRVSADERQGQGQGRDRSHSDSRNRDRDHDRDHDHGHELPHGLESPPTPGPSRTRRQGKHKYHAVPTELNRDDRDRDRGPDLKKAGLSAYNKALWKWVNVTDLDGFLQEVYYYYEGKGFWCILLKRSLDSLVLLFVIGFTTFLTQCIDYSKLRSSVGPNNNGRLEDALVGHCLAKTPFWHKLVLILVCGWYALRLLGFVLSIPFLRDMYNFYTYLLGVPDADIQTMPWPEIVRLIGDIKKHHPVTSHSNGGALAQVIGQPKNESPKLDAHDIANRILRQENYLIALFNKDLLDLRVRLPIPKAIEHFVPPSLVTGAPGSGLPKNSTDEKKYLTFGGSTLTRALVLNIRFCVMDYVFDSNGQVKKEVVRDRTRKELVKQLQQRFIFMGLVNAILAPFIVVWELIYMFFRYFAEYHKNPSSVGSRKYTLFAQWKFREFNELPHLFERRLNQSYPVAKEYIDQFPKERTSLVMRFVGFVAGAFTAVLVVASLLDPDLFIHFEITPHRTVIFYIGVFGSILAIARGMVPEENTVFDPEYLMRELIRYTHYLPPEWKGKLHSQKVHQDFGQLFQMKVVIFAQELLSVLLTPFVLWFSLPGCSGAIVDFFREFTIHVEGMGYVCSFAVFDFHRPGAVGPEGAEAAAAAATTAGAPPSPIIRRRSAVGGGLVGGPAHHVAPPRGNFYDNKMEQSFLHFKNTHPDWQPSDPSASVFLDRLMSDNKDQHAHGRSTQVPLAGSMYGGNRALGLGLHMGGHPRDRRALSPGGHERHSGPGARWFQPASEHIGLETMDERETDELVEDQGTRLLDDAEAEAMGWDRRIVTDDSEEMPEHRGLLRDAGILLNQVMNR